jgi:hypothetical protein
MSSEEVIENECVTEWGQGWDRMSKGMTEGVTDGKWGCVVIFI